MTITADTSEDISLSAVFVLVLWIGCSTVALLGFILPYARPLLAKKMEMPIRAEIVQVELTSDPLPASAPQPEAAALQPPAAAAVPLAPQVPAMTAVAEPNTVAFALPVEGPVTVVETAKASFAPAPIVKEAAPVAAPQVTTLTYGKGEGRQPAPEYPLRARREGQEGVVGVRFTVAEDGHVLAADTSLPSPWKLLNEAAVRVVRERWRFSTGAVRLYEVSIRFQLLQ